MTQIAPSRVNITVGDARSKDNQLNEAVDRLIPIAMAAMTGILVTQHSMSSYTLEVHASVPVGTILEKRFHKHEGCINA